MATSKSLLSTINTATSSAIPSAAAVNSSSYNLSNLSNTSLSIPYETHKLRMRNDISYREEVTQYLINHPEEKETFPLLNSQIKSSKLGLLSYHKKKMNENTEYKKKVNDYLKKHQNETKTFPYLSIEEKNKRFLSLLQKVPSQSKKAASTASAAAPVAASATASAAAPVTAFATAPVAASSSSSSANTQLSRFHEMKMKNTEYKKKVDAYLKTHPDEKFSFPYLSLEEKQKRFLSLHQNVSSQSKKTATSASTPTKFRLLANSSSAALANSSSAALVNTLLSQNISKGEQFTIDLNIEYTEDIPELHKIKGFIFIKKAISDNGWCFYNSIAYGLGLVDGMGPKQTNENSYNLAKIIGKSFIDMINRNAFIEEDELLSRNSIVSEYTDAHSVKMKKLKKLFEKKLFEKELKKSSQPKNSKKSMKPNNLTNEEIRQIISGINNEIKNKTIDNEYIISEITKSFTPKNPENLNEGPIIWPAAAFFGRILVKFILDQFKIGICIYTKKHKNSLNLWYKFDTPNTRFYISLLYNGRDHYDSLIPNKELRDFHTYKANFKTYFTKLVNPIWICPMCTFKNPSTATVCEMCQYPKAKGLKGGGYKLSKKFKTTRKLILKKQKKTKKH